MRVVLAHEDPGVPNWIDTEARPRGLLVFRLIGATAGIEPEAFGRAVFPSDLPAALLQHAENVCAFHLLEAARDAGVSSFIFSSSCAGYGEPETVPIVGKADIREGRMVTIEYELKDADGNAVDVRKLRAEAAARRAAEAAAALRVPKRVAARATAPRPS